MMRPYPWLMHLSRRAKKPLYLHVALSIFAGILILTQAFLIAALLYDFYFQHVAITTLSPSLCLLLGCISLRAITSIYREKYAFKTARIIKNALRQQLFLAYISGQKAANNRNHAHTASILIEQIEGLHGFFADYLPQLFVTCILPMIMLGFVFSENSVCGFILLITAPLIPLFMAFIGIQTAKRKQENFTLLGKLSVFFLDALQGLPTLTLYHRAAAQLTRITQLSEDFRVKTMQILRIAFLSSAALELFATISIAMIAVYLGLGLLHQIHFGFPAKGISLEKALFILLLAPEFFMPLRQLGHFYHARAEAIAAAETIQPLLDSKENSVETTPFIAANIDLSVNNLTFSYDQKIVLKNLSIAIPFGTCLLITGESGAGKSTFLHLLAKLLSPQEGNILANKLSLTQIEEDSWYHHIALLHQYPRLTTGTIYDNIAFAKPAATQTEIMEAARLAGVMDFSQDLSEKNYEQNVGLSGGQIQRIALARIILKDAPIVLFDEPTNYLDEKNIVIFKNLIHQWRGKKTLVIATHDEKFLTFCKTPQSMEYHLLQLP